MLINCLTFCLLVCLPLETISHNHNSKKRDEHREHKANTDLEKSGLIHKSQDPNKTTNLKVSHAEKKLGSNSKHNKNHSKKTSLVKKRRSIDGRNTFQPQYQKNGKIYPVTTDVPFVFQPFIKSSDLEGGQQFISTQRVKVQDFDKIREDLRKRFDSYSWKHSFKPALWTNLFKEMEHSLHRMRKIHEERQKTVLAHHMKLSKNSGTLCTSDDSNLRSIRNCQQRNPSSFKFTTIKPVSINWNNQLGSNSFPTFPPEMVTESYSEIEINKKYEHYDSKASDETVKSYHHSLHHSGRLHSHHHDLKFEEKKEHHHSPGKPHSHQEQKSHHHHHCHHKGGENGNHHSVTPLKCPHRSDVFHLNPIELNPITDMKPSLDTDVYQNGTSDGVWPLIVNDKKEPASRNVSSNYKGYSTPTSVNNFSNFEKNESGFISPTKNKFHHHIHMNHDLDKVSVKGSDNTSEKPIHFPDVDQKAKDVKDKNDLCKDGKSIEIPLLNINLPCGDLSVNGGNPDDYYKREFATSMTNVFHDYIEKEKEKDEENYDIDIRLGKVKRSVNTGNEERKRGKNEPNSSENKTIGKNLKVQKERNGSVFGEIMDVPKDLTKPDSFDYFDVSMLSDYFLEAVENLDEGSLVDVLKALKEDYLAKSPGDQSVVDEVYEKLVSSLLDYKRSNGSWTERRRRESPSKAKEGAAAVLELLAESDKDLEEMQDDPFANDYYGDYNDKDHGPDSNDNPSFLELVSLADKHKSKVK